jgi:hypothetical protein
VVTHQTSQGALDVDDVANENPLFVVFLFVLVLVPLLL